jgi:septal ring factor EnvC (AmiA/AmiB activator)
VDPCIIGGELRRRRLALVPGAVVWELAEEVLMEKAQADLTALKKQGDELQRQCADSAATLKSINETLKGLSTWVPHVDSTLQVLQKSVDAMGNRVTQLEGAQREIE